MNNKEQIKFVKELIKNVSHEIYSKADKFPEDWEGIELRQYISDCFRAAVFDRVLKGKRFKSYQNEVIIRNL